ncbi:MAG: hypothetical protein ACRDSZ_25705 [Pseudonocardiaceae bacterium]
MLVGFEEGARVLRALIAQGVNPQNTRIYGTDGNMSASLPGQVDQNKPGVLAGMRGTTLLPLNPDFRRRLETISGGPGHPVPVDQPPHCAHRARPRRDSSGLRPP